MKKFFAKSLIATAIAASFAGSAFADTTPVLGNPAATGVVSTGYTQVADIVQNIAGASISNVNNAMSSAPSGAPAGWINNWDITQQNNTASAVQTVKQDAKSIAVDGNPATVGSVADPSKMAVQSNVATSAGAFKLTSLNAAGNNVSGGAQFFSQVSNTSNAGVDNITGKPLTSMAATAGQVDPTGNGTNAFAGGDQNLTTSSVVAGVGNTTGAGSLSLTGTQAGKGNQELSTVLSAPAAGSPVATIRATMDASHAVNLALNTAVTGGVFGSSNGTSIGSFSSQNQSKVDQTYLVGANMITPKP